MECCICLDSVKKTFDCPSCLPNAEKVCYKCLLTYLKGKETPQCPVCKSVLMWNQINTPANLNKLKQQVIAFNDKSQNDIYLQSSKYLIPKVLENGKTEEKIMSLTNELSVLRDKMNALADSISELETKSMKEYESIISHNEDAYTYNCPRAGCNGVLDMKGAICVLCKADVCVDCISIIKDDEVHECNQETLATIKEINISSRPCPKCKILIDKAEGCTTMYCTKCNTPFNWITGDIVKGSFHNPHSAVQEKQEFKIDYNVDSDVFRDLDEKDFPSRVGGYVGVYMFMKIYTESAIEHNSVLKGRMRYLSALKLINKIDDAKYEHEMKTHRDDLFQTLYILQKLRNIKDVFEMFFNMAKGMSGDTLADIILNFKQNVIKYVKDILKLPNDDSMIELKMILTLLTH